METPQHKFNAPIPGESLTAELGSRPWQRPPQYSDINEIVEDYVTKMNTDEFSKQLADTMEMGIPLTTLANSIQLAGVMQGKHTVDTGILVMPILIEQMMAIGDALGIKYNSGLEDDANLLKNRDSLAHSSIMKLRKEKEKTEGQVPISQPVEKESEIPMKTEPMGLMSRRAE
jgi:hypothetical protein